MTTTTTELPPLAEAMTAADLSLHQTALQSALGGNGDVYFNITRGGPKRASIQIYPTGICGGDRRRDQYINASSWPEAIQEASAWIATNATVAREATIRRLAFSIIDLTDQHGKCDMIMLLRRDFTADEVRDLHADACVRAGELCAGAPFVVEGVS